MSNSPVFDGTVTLLLPFAVPPRLQYAANTLAACVAWGLGEVMQLFSTFVEI